MLQKLANINDAAALIFGTTMTLTGPVIADAAQIPGVEYLTPFGLLMVVLWSVGAMVRKIQTDGAKQTDDYIQALIEQNKYNAANAAEATKTIIQMNRETITCMESTRNTVQDLERVVKESHAINQQMSLAVNRQLQHAAELIEGWKGNFPCVALQSAEGRSMLAKKVKEKEAE